MGKIWEATKFIYKHRDKLMQIKNELWNLKIEVHNACMDKKIERGEMVDILRKADALLDTTIQILEND